MSPRRKTCPHEQAVRLGAGAMSPTRAVSLAPEDYEYALFGGKTCTVCGRRLPANGDFFGRDHFKADRLTSACRDCRREQSRRTHERQLQFGTGG